MSFYPGEPEVEVALEARESVAQNASCSDDDGDSSKADKILELISKIGSNHILANVAKADGGEFHPWFWEPSQGRLMTV